MIERDALVERASGVLWARIPGASREQCRYYAAAVLDALPELAGSEPADTEQEVRA